MAEVIRPVCDAGISHLGLSVSGLDRSVAFYCDVLGARLLRQPYDGERGNFRMAIVMWGSLPIDLYQHDGSHAERFDPARTGLDHLGFQASSESELAAWAVWLDHKGVRRSDIRDIEGGLIFDFVDPDGIQLEFFYLDQGEQAPSTA